jgi:hypothetical protein
MRLRRGAVPVLLWCLATTASIGVASLALRPVLRTAVPEESVPAAADETGDRKVVTQTIPPPPIDTGAPTSAAVTASKPAGGQPASSVPPAATTGAGSPTPRPTTGSPARLVDGWTVTTGSDGVDLYIRSFRTDGGDAVIRIRAGVVSVVTATPRDGYSVSQGQTEPTRLVVQFIAGGGGSAWLVDCMWWQNAPHGEVTRIGS